MKTFAGYHKGVNFGGWFSQCPHTQAHYDSFLSLSDIDRAKAMGFDHIRLPIDYELLENPDGTPAEQGYARLAQVIERCGSLGLNLILDLHKTAGYSFDGGEAEDGFFGSEELQERFYLLWEEIARRFGKYHAFVAFELLNEVTEAEYSPVWNRVSERCCARIRAYAPETYILIGSYWNNSVLTLEALPMPFDDRIVYNFHCYEPMLFTHQGGHWVVNMPLDFRMQYPCTAAEYLRLHRETGVPAPEIFEVAEAQDSSELFEKLFAKAAQIAAERQVALYCGEYGVIDLADADSTEAWFRDIHSAFEKYGIGRAVWSYRSMNFGLTDPDREAICCRILPLL